MFVGAHPVTVDGKGRVSIPAPFRAALAGAEHVFLWPSYAGACLEGGGLALLDARRAAIEMEGAPAREDLEYAVFAEARALKIDETGRISLPGDLRAHAGLNGEATFAGLGARFEVWTPGALALRVAQARARAAARRTPEGAP
jgi:MraZ protein